MNKLLSLNDRFWRWHSHLSLFWGALITLLMVSPLILGLQLSACGYTGRPTALLIGITLVIMGLRVLPRSKDEPTATG